MASRLKPIQTPQVQAHQREPAAAISQSTRASKGPPISTPKSRDLIRSCTHSLALVLLKPKRSSITNVAYNEKGNSRSVLMAVKAPTRASCCHKPAPMPSSNMPFSVDKPPSRVQAKVRAAPQANSIRPKRVLATV